MVDETAPKKVYCKIAKCKCYANLVNGVCPKHVMLQQKEKGDVIYPCLECAEPCTDTQKALMCECCVQWIHIACEGLDETVYDVLFKGGESVGNLRYDCKKCRAKVCEAVEKFKVLEQDTAELKSAMKDVKKDVSSIKTTIKETVQDGITNFLSTNQDFEKRKMNLIVFGLPELPDNQQQLDIPAKKKLDKEAITKIIQDELNVALSPRTGISNASRLGAKQVGKTRPVKIEFLDINAKRDVLSKAKNLRKSTSDIAKKIYINPDLNKDQLKAEKELRKQMWERRANGENVIIRRGNIVTADHEVRKTRDSTNTAQM